jgi:hypothetical protein
MKNPPAKFKYLIILLILPFSMGCFLTRMARSILSDPTPTTPPEVNEIVPTTEPEALPTLEDPVVEPNPEPTQEVIQNGGASHEPICTQVDDLHICAPYGLVDSLVVSTIPEIAVDGGAPWETSPQHFRVDFQGYPLHDTFWQPRMEIFPLAEFKTMSPDLINPQLEKLETILKEKPAHIQSVPILPMVNAGALFSARPMYFDDPSTSVRGFSVLTQFGQSFWPINNRDMFYTFQGVTTDGKYWITLVLPVTQQDLSPDGEYITSQDFQSFADNFQNYIQKTTDQLEAADEFTFTPDLTSFEMVIAYSFTQY